MSFLKTFLGEPTLRPPLKSFLLLKLLKINSAGKTALEKKTKIGAFSLIKKISEYALDMKQFQRAYERPFPGLNVLTSLYLVNIQPNSKLHPPHQNFVNPPLDSGYVLLCQMKMIFRINMLLKI